MFQAGRDIYGSHVELALVSRLARQDTAQPLHRVHYCCVLLACFPFAFVLCRGGYLVALVRSFVAAVKS
jgi:hypothetical protein